VILTRAKLMAHSQLFNEGSEHRIAGGVLYEIYNTAHTVSGRYHPGVGRV